MIRNGSPADVPFMRSMLAHAYAWRVNALDADIPLTRYVDNWGRAGDLALIAHETGNRVGAAWFRLFTADEPGYGFVDEQTPELSISVVPSRRRHGVGQELLDALLGKAKAAGHAAVSLSVENDSPAVAFYERNGFVPSGESDGGARHEARPLANLVRRSRTRIRVVSTQRQGLNRKRKGHVEAAPRPGRGEVGSRRRSRVSRYAVHRLRTRPPSR